jgi:hypothetical protein
VKSSRSEVASPGLAAQEGKNGAPLSHFVGSWQPTLLPDGSFRQSLSNRQRSLVVL